MKLKYVIKSVIQKLPNWNLRNEICFYFSSDIPLYTPH